MELWSIKFRIFCAEVPTHLILPSRYSVLQAGIPTEVFRVFINSVHHWLGLEIADSFLIPPGKVYHQAF
jgi:hypothetical protein